MSVKVLAFVKHIFEKPKVRGQYEFMKGSHNILALYVNNCSHMMSVFQQQQLLVHDIKKEYRLQYYISNEFGGNMFVRVFQWV